MAKIEPVNKKNPHDGNILNTVTKNLWRLKNSQADPREKIELEVIQSSIKTLLRRFELVKYTIAHTLSILTRFDTNFLENTSEFNHGSVREMN